MDLNLYINEMIASGKKEIPFTEEIAKTTGKPTSTICRWRRRGGIPLVNFKKITTTQQGLRSTLKQMSEVGFDIKNLYIFAGLPLNKYHYFMFANGSLPDALQNKLIGFIKEVFNLIKTRDDIMPYAIYFRLNIFDIKTPSAKRLFYAAAKTGTGNNIPGSLYKDVKEKMLQLINQFNNL